ncbi:MAG TPA: DUF2079 domain-containing protein [Streptosporangiaceae bacterium]|nr:DUF2079 domain-containing protein [Streptosporangiaceae bacterium]
MSHSAGTPATAMPDVGRTVTVGGRDWVPWVVALAASAAYSVISIMYYLRLDPGSYDLAIFTEYVKQYAHLHAPIVDVKAPGFDLLGDHFHPIVALIGPFWLFAASPVTLLVAQALLMALSVIPVSRAAAELLGRTASRWIAVAYAFSWGLQTMAWFDFHELAFAVPLLALSLSALVRGRIRAAVLWAMPLVFVKEDQGFTVAVIGLLLLGSAWTTRRRARQAATVQDAGSGEEQSRPAGLSGRWWPGLFLVVWGIGCSVITIELIIPHFNPAHIYYYWGEGGVVGGNNQGWSALPGQLVHGYPGKLETLVQLLLPVAFLALRSPVGLIAVPNLALRYVNTNSNYWGPWFHYNAPLMPILFIAAIDALRRLREAEAVAAVRPRYRRLVAGTIRYAPAAMVAIAVALAFRFPLNQLWNPRQYTTTPVIRAEKTAIGKVPAGTTVEASTAVAASLAARDDTFLLDTPDDPAPRYIVFDDTANPWAPTRANAPRYIRRLHPKASYQQIYLADGVYVFRRSGPGPS